ncbi:CoA-binding protein [Betaproteobacteria bacterium]|nr:CoA-binding protein [Betaproteobacteria bacterium]GHU46675.1 CoA-binding protein [Betaproteobacteria bacterium]
MLTNDQDLRQLLQKSRTIAIVGLSDKTDRPSNAVAQYLLKAGYTVIPVNPAKKEILGQTCYPNLAAVPDHIDLVDVFRRSEEAPGVAQEAVEAGAGAIWLQLGVISPEAVSLAEKAGLATVMDRCTEIEHWRLLGETREDAEALASAVYCPLPQGKGSRRS